MSNDIRRRLFCLLLVLSMLVSLCPAGVFAGDEYEEWCEASEDYAAYVSVDGTDGIEDGFVEYEESFDAAAESVDGEYEPAVDDEEPGVYEEEAAVSEEEEPGEYVEACGEEEERGFPGLPEDCALSAEQVELREAMAAHGAAAALAGLVPGVDYVEDEVWLLAGSADEARLAAEAYGAELLSFDWGVAVLRLDGATVYDAVAAAEDPAQKLPPVSPDYIETSGPEPSELRGAKDAAAQDARDSYARRSWEYWRDVYGDDLDFYLRDPGAPSAAGSADEPHYQYMHEAVNSFAAWGVTKGEGVLVAVVDSGVADHEDLPEIRRIVVAPSLDRGANPVYPHGTHVGGIVGARLGNGIGGAGIAPEVSLLSIQVLNDSGSGSRSNIIKGINAAAEAGADIINISIGGKYWDANYEQAVRNAVEAGVTVVCSAGNDGSNVMNYPGTFDIPGLICVGAVTRGGSRGGYSNFGPWVDIWAPGSAIWSTAPGNGYRGMSGTSMAVPVVSGACALYMARYGHTDPVTMEKVIKASAVNGTLDVSCLFERDREAPEIRVEGLSGGRAPYGARLSFTLKPGDTVLYTLDGTTPSLRDGKAADGSLIYSGSPAALTKTPAKAFTVTAVRVNGLGEVSKAAKLSVTLDYAAAGSVAITECPETLAAGRSVTLKAAVSPEAAKQTVVWSIVSRSGAPGAAISAAGRLTAKAGDAGTVTVRAACRDFPEISATAEIAIGNVQTASGIRLSLDDGAAADKLTLRLSGQAGSAQLRAEAVDRSGQPVHTAFSWSSTNPKVAVVSREGAVTAVGRGSAAIVCTALDGSSVSARCAVSVAQDVTAISIEGPDTLAPSKRIRLTAKVQPADANDKSLAWSVDEAAAAAGVTVINGTLTIPADCACGSVTVTARARDGSGVSAEYTAKLQRAVGRLSLYLDYRFHFAGGGSVENADGTLRELTLYSVEQDYWDGSAEKKAWKDSEALLMAAFDIESEARIIWTSSNERVVRVEDGHLYAVGAGSATVTARVNDTGGKKASVKVKVINPVSSVTVVSSAPAMNADALKYSSNITVDRLLGIGKSVGNKAVLGDAFGNPTKGRVNWSCGVEVYERGSGSEAFDVEDQIRELGLVKISRTGTLSAAAKLRGYADDYAIFATVTAVSAEDNSMLSGSCVYWIVPLTTKIGVQEEVHWDNSQRAFVLPIVSDGEPWTVKRYTVTSSSPKAGTAKMSGSNLLLYPNTEQLPADGRVMYSTIKVSACDGSGKSMSIKVGFSCENHSSAADAMNVTISKYPWL